MTLQKKRAYQQHRAGEPARTARLSMRTHPEVAEGARRLGTEAVEALILGIVSHHKVLAPGWQSMETAPKDKIVLLWGAYGGGSFFSDPIAGQWCPYNERWEAAANFRYGVSPTHWMPLPQKPV